MIQEGFNLWNPHIFGVTLFMKQNVTPNPLDVGFLSPVGVVFEANLVFNLV